VTCSEILQLHLPNIYFGEFFISKIADTCVLAKLGMKGSRLGALNHCL
jgi:hypothetical protein